MRYVFNDHYRKTFRKNCGSSQSFSFLTAVAGLCRVLATILIAVITNKGLPIACVRLIQSSLVHRGYSRQKRARAGVIVVIGFVTNLTNQCALKM